MSRLATIALALITSLLSSQSDAEATPRWKRQSTTPRFQIVGFTTATFQGKAGVLAFSLTCGQEIQGARLCSSEEVLSRCCQGRIRASGSAARRRSQGLGFEGEVVEPTSGLEPLTCSLRVSGLRCAILAGC